MRSRETTVPSWTFLHRGQKNIASGKKSSVSNCSSVGYLLASGWSPRLRNSIGSFPPHSRQFMSRSLIDFVDFEKTNTVRYLLFKAIHGARRQRRAVSNNRESQA